MPINRQQRRAEKAGRKPGPSAAGSQDRGVAPGKIADLFVQAVRRHQAGALAEAVVLYEQALSHDPNVPEALSNLGLALKDLGRPDAAVARYEQALALKPDVPEVLSNLGLALKDLGRLGEAIARYRQALALRPNYPEALSNLGNALADQGRADEAVACFRQALTLRPNYPEALSNLGIVLRNSGKLDEAIACYERALALKPSLPDTLSNLGDALQQRGRLDEAIARYEQALALRPDFAGALCNLANGLKDQGKADEAIVRCEQALALEPSYADAHSNLLLTLQYSERHSSTNTLAEARRFASQVETGHRRHEFANAPEPERRLRVGYVSPDFRTHPIGLLLDGVLTAHDPADIEVFCYTNSAVTDDVTLRLMAAGQWRNIVGVPDTEACSMIRRDGIDILVDLCGHTAKNRLPLFALKPAPVQVTWLGYVDTTGLQSMDYILADRFVVPPGAEADFTETVWRLPDTYFCMATPGSNMPAATRDVPADAPLTLGCFNNWAKVTPGTVALWARILAALPDSRLFLKTNYLDNPGMRRVVLDRFADAGVGPERLILEGPSPRAGLLAAYNRVDIALDPFPYGGGMTTVEALSMGVPVITLRGRRWVGHVTESVLRTVGLGDLVADDAEAYERAVLRLAEDRARLGELRRRLRPMMEGSPFCDGPRFTRSLEAGYRGMWKIWCAERMAEEH
jgi:predicted O-linked N-acetylglucosamine transferase (SPINDLY family)